MTTPVTNPFVGEIHRATGLHIALNARTFTSQSQGAQTGFAPAQESSAFFMTLSGAIHAILVITDPAICQNSVGVLQCSVYPYLHRRDSFHPTCKKPFNRRMAWEAQQRREK